VRPPDKAVQLVGVRTQVEALRWIVAHPLNRGRRIAALLRWLVTQIRSRLGQTPRLVPFIDHTRLYIGPGLTSANMQYYAGLGEPDVMGFLMHYVRSTDVFADVGANVGVMTVLAAGVGGARAIAIEPDAATHAWLERNVTANDLGGRVRCIRAAVGESAGELRLTAGLGAANRAADATEAGGQTVPCQTLDRLLDDEHPTVLKADVEGFELPMLRGASAVLADARLRAVVLELKNHGARYGFDENEIRAQMRTQGFHPHSYDPITRQLIALSDGARRPDNTIFLRDAVEAAERLRSAQARRVIWGQLV
jgi:FkbM family methyltransferase